MQFGQHARHTREQSLLHNFFCAKVDISFAAQQYAGPCCAAALLRCTAVCVEQFPLFNKRPSLFLLHSKKKSLVDVSFALPWFRPNKRTIGQLVKFKVFKVYNCYILKNLNSPRLCCFLSEFFPYLTVILEKTLTREKSPNRRSLFRKKNYYIVQKL